MVRFLVKKHTKGFDVVKVGKGNKIERSSKGLRVKTKTKTGVWFKGYKVVNAKSLKDVTEKQGFQAVRRTRRKTTRRNNMFGGVFG